MLLMFFLLLSLKTLIDSLSILLYKSNPTWEPPLWLYPKTDPDPLISKSFEERLYPDPSATFSSIAFNLLFPSWFSLKFWELKDKHRLAYYAYQLAPLFGVTGISQINGHY